MRALNGLLLVSRSAFGSALRGKRVLALLALCAPPLVVAQFTVAHGTDIGLDDFLVCYLMVIAQVSVPFGALFLGIAVLGDEIDGRTITYLFTRPLPRYVFFLGRLLGFCAAYGLLLALTVFLTTRIYSSRVDIGLAATWASMAIAVSGLLVYAAFFATLRALFKRALYVGFFLVFIVEIFIAKMPVGALSRISVWHHLTVLTARSFELRQGFAARNLPNIEAAETVSGSVTFLVCFFAVSLIAGMRIAMTREFRLPAAVG